MEIKTDIAAVKTDISWMKESHKKMDRKMDEFIQSADNKYASKLTEKIVYGIIGTICTIVLITIIGLVTGG